MKETASKNWVTKTIAILAIVAVVFLVLSIIFKLVAILFKPAVVVLAVAAVYYLVKNSSNKYKRDIKAMNKQTFWCHTRCEGESLFQSSYTSGGFLL